MSDQPRILSSDVTRWAEAIAGLARTGLAFSENSYDLERYEEVLHIAGDMVAALSANNPPADEQVEIWQAMVKRGVFGYATPKVGSGAYVGNDKGELLLIKRADIHQWFVPTGWADIGYSPSEVIVKEVAEECGLEVEPIQLISVIDNMRAGSSIPHYTMMFYCKAIGSDLRAHPVEVEDIGWFTQDNMPEPLFSECAPWVERAFAAIRGEITQTWFDAPRNPLWRPNPEAHKP